VDSARAAGGEEA